MKRTLLVVLVAAALLGVLFAVSANLFPDWTWKIVNPAWSGAEQLLRNTLRVGLSKHSPAKRSEVSAAEYEVLSAWIANTFNDEKGKKKGYVGVVNNIVILDVTQYDQSGPLMDPLVKVAAQSLLEKAPSLRQTTVDSFRQVNAQQASLHRSFQVAIHCELVEPRDLD